MSSKPRSTAAAHNARAWDTLALRDAALTRPATAADLADPLRAVDPAGWLGPSITGWRVLCLAAGGGRQSALFAAAGARVTVVDISPEMLERDRRVAAERGLDIRAIEASMDDLSMLVEAGPGATKFDAVAQPVSTCYVPDVAAVYREVARVLRPGGVYVSQHKTPTSLQSSVKPIGEHFALTEPYYRTGPLPPAPPCRTREPGTHEFLHRWEELVGGLCRAGFVVEDLVEPTHADPRADAGSFGHRSRYAAPYVRIKARRVETEQAGDGVGERPPLVLE